MFKNLGIDPWFKIIRIVAVRAFDGPFFFYFVGFLALQLVPTSAGVLCRSSNPMFPQC